MKLLPTQFRLPRAIAFFSLVVGILLIILVSVMAFFQVGRSFEIIQKDIIEHEITELSLAVQTFLKYRLAVLTDHARFPILTQGVMQPETLQANLIDFMGGLSILGKKSQLVLLDFKGRGIHATQEKPVFDYTGEKWLNQLLTDERKEYVGISKKHGAFFWRIAVPVMYADLTEGILVAELDISEFKEYQNISQVAHHYQIELISNNMTVASFGPSLHGKYQEFPVQNMDLTLRYRLDRTGVNQERSNLIIEITIGILATVSLVIIISLSLADRLYVRPLLQLRQLVHNSTTDRGTNHIPTTQKLKEISALAEDFNWMLDQRNSREEDLIIARNNLELRVQERTKELQSSQEALQKINDNLELEVQSRTRELEHVHSQLAMQEKMASVGQLAAGIAHELNNPINFVRTNFAALMDNFSDLLKLFPEYQRFLEKAEKDAMWQNKIAEVRTLEEKLNISFLTSDIPVLFDESEQGFQRIAKIIKSMRDFSRVDQLGELAWVNINKGIEDTLVIARHEYKYHATIETHLGDIEDVYCSLEQLNQVFLNLIVNSAHAIAAMGEEKKGYISITTWQDTTHVFCEFKDNGPGIPQEHRNRIFEPFFTTKPPGQGTGLGLSISYDIVVRKHHGQFLLECPEGGGTIFTLSLPKKPREDIPITRQEV